MKKSLIQNLAYKIKTYSSSESEQANLSNDSIKFWMLSFRLNSVSNIGSDLNLVSPVAQNLRFDDRTSRLFTIFGMDWTQDSSFKFSGPIRNVSRISQLEYWLLGTPNTVKSNDCVQALESFSHWRAFFTLNFES